MSFQVGDTVGDYEIVGILGAGGMGKVYKVKNQISERVDAMKVLLPNLADDQELADRFIREIKVLASLNHPNIAGLRTAFRLDNQLLMVMEFVEGKSLDERTKLGAIPLEEAISYIQQALAALIFSNRDAADAFIAACALEPAQFCTGIRMSWRRWQRRFFIIVCLTLN